MSCQEKPRPLNPRQQRFVAEYLVDLYGTQAAIRAGYAAKCAHVTAHQFLRNPKIVAALSAGKAAQFRSAELSASRVLEELRRLAFVDLGTFFKPDGSVMRPCELTPEQGACIAGFEVLIKNAAAGDGVTDLVHKFRRWDELRAPEMLAKHYAP